MSDKFKFLVNTTDKRSFEYLSFETISNFKSKPGMGTPLQFYFALEGRGTYVINGTKYEFKQGDILVQNPEVHIGLSASENEFLTFIGLGVTGKKMHFKNNQLFTFFSPGINSYFFHLIKRLYVIMNDDKTKNDDIINKYFEIIFDEVLRYNETTYSEISFKKHSELIYRAVEYIDTNFNQKITIDNICSYLMCSQSSLLHQFKKEIGKTVIEYILDKKIEVAKYTLRATSRTIFDICDDIGFSSPQFFYKLFYKKVGMTPKEYREKNTI